MTTTATYPSSSSYSCSGYHLLLGHIHSSNDWPLREAALKIHNCTIHNVERFTVSIIVHLLRLWSCNLWSLPPPHHLIRLVLSTAPGPHPSDSYANRLWRDIDLLICLFHFPSAFCPKKKKKSLCTICRKSISFILFAMIFPSPTHSLYCHPHSDTSWRGRRTRNERWWSNSGLNWIRIK